MSVVPLPPFLPEGLEAFTGHVSAHYPDWFKYCREAYEYIEGAETALADAREKTTQSDLRAQALDKEVEHLKQQHQIELARLKGARDYQDELIQKITQKLVEALKEKDQALSLTTPSGSSPRSTPASTLSSEIPMITPAKTSKLSTEVPRLSERLPDPDKFEGDRKDLRRFVSQIHEKMNVNYDRFLTPQSRMTYVTNRLKGQPYAQILPYIKKGVCCLSDYEEILDHLEHAFGDPNRVNNARSELFRLRQANKDFSIFFAEFQRLALEGEMSEDSLPVLLEQAINRELRAMLIHHEPPSRQYHNFAKFLQGLENRRQHYENAPGPTPKIYAIAAKARSMPVPSTVTPLTSPSLTPTTPRVRDPDAMDLGYQRRRPTSPISRRDRGECFRCGSSKHLVRDCPMPDTRPVRTMGPMRGRSTSPVSASPSPKSSSPVPSNSVKGMSLE